MSLTTCPHCQSKISVPPQAAGKFVGCPHCGQKWREPSTKTQQRRAATSPRANRPENQTTAAYVPPGSARPSKPQAPEPLIRSERPSRRQRRAVYGCLLLGGTALLLLVGLLAALGWVGVKYWRGSLDADQPPQQLAEEHQAPTVTPSKSKKVEPGKPARGPAKKTEQGKKSAAVTEKPGTTPSSTLKPQTPPAWIEEATQLLKAAREVTIPVEPLPRPELWTELEYQRAKIPGLHFKKVSPESAANTWALVCRHPNGQDACELWPYTSARVQREAYKAWSESAAMMNNLDNQLTLRPYLRPLKSAKLLQEMRARSTWPQRKKLYEQLAQFTEDRRDWSLLHPFDDLSTEEMQQVVSAAELAKNAGLGALTSQQRIQLLLAGEADFFEKLLKNASP